MNARETNEKAAEPLGLTSESVRSFAMRMPSDQIPKISERKEDEIKEVMLECGHEGCWILSSRK